MKKRSVLLTPVFALFMLGCQKEVTLDLVSDNSVPGSTSGNSLVEINGTWKFINARAKTTSIIEYDNAGVAMKTVTNSDYTTVNNTGTITFNGTDMIYDKVSYSMNTIAYGKSYEKNVLTDTFSAPITAAIPPMDGKSAFTRVGLDSITFLDSSSPLSGGAQSTKPGGAKLLREQDKLYLTQKISEVSTTNQQGLVVKKTSQAEVITTLQKH